MGRVEELAAAWDATDLLVETRDGGRVRWPAGAPAPAALLADLPFGVLTAHNPGGEDAPPAVNAARDADLRARAGAALRVTGRSPDGAHAEPGYALLGRDLPAALDLAREYGQLAIYWCEPGGFTWVLT